MEKSIRPVTLALITWVFISLCITLGASLFLTALLTTDYDPTFFGLLTYSFKFLKNWEPEFYPLLFLPIAAPLILGIIAGHYKKFTKFLTFALPILALIPITLIYLIVLGGNCGGEAAIFCMGIVGLLIALEVLVFIVALSVLPVAWSVHRFGIQNYRSIMQGSLIPGLIVLFGFFIFFTVSSLPWSIRLVAEANQKKEKIAEVKAHITLLEPEYLPAKVRSIRREEPISNGIIWEYSCNNKPNSFTITQVAIDKWMQSPIWDLRQKRLNEIEEYYQKDHKSHPTSGMIRENRKDYSSRFEEVSINNRKGLYITEYYTGITISNLLVWESDESLIELGTDYPGICGISKEEFIKVAESMVYVVKLL